MNDPKEFKDLALQNDILIISEDQELSTKILEGVNVKILSKEEIYQYPRLASRIDPYVQIFQSLASQASVYITLRIVESLIAEATKDLYIKYIKKPFFIFLKKHKSDNPYESRPGGAPVNMLIQLTPEVLLKFNFLKGVDEEDYENAFQDLPLFLTKVKELNPTEAKSLDDINHTRTMLCYFNNKKKEWFIESWAGCDVFSEITGE